VVRDFKRHLIGYAWVIAFRELLRVPRIPVEIRRGSVILAALLTSPFVISAFAWWVLTGKRLPKPLGAWLGDPTVVRVNMFRKLPPTLLEGSARLTPLGIPSISAGVDCEHAALEHRSGVTRIAQALGQRTFGAAVLSAARCLSASVFWEVLVEAEKGCRGGIGHEGVSRVLGWELPGGFDEDGVEAVALLASCCRAVGSDGAAHDLRGFCLSGGRDDQARLGGPAGFVVLMSNPPFHGASDYRRRDGPL
jgi:hypothetical protein